jgi:hypothetical protein
MKNIYCVRIVASIWILVYIIRMHGTMNIKKSHSHSSLSPGYKVTSHVNLQATFYTWRNSNRPTWYVRARHSDLCWIKTSFLDRGHTNIYSQISILRHLHLPLVKVLKEKFRIIHHFRITPPSIYGNKLRSIISGAVSETEISWNTAYEFSVLLLVTLYSF